MFRHTNLLLLVLLPTLAYFASMATAQTGGCRCLPKTAQFSKQFYRAHIVVRAFVLSHYTSCHLCPKLVDRRNAVTVYTLYTYRRFRGPNPGSVFFAQSFQNINYCGVRLRKGQTYMLNLADPRKISAASHWTPGWYVLDACQSQYNWVDLDSNQKAFLNNRL